DLGPMRRFLRMEDRGWHCADTANFTFCLLRFRGCLKEACVPDRLRQVEAALPGALSWRSRTMLLRSHTSTPRGSRCCLSSLVFRLSSPRHSFSNSFLHCIPSTNRYSSTTPS